MTEKINDLTEKFSRLYNAHKNIFNNIQTISGENNSGFDLSKHLPGTEISIVDFEARISYLCDLANSELKSQDELLIPQSFFTSITKPLDQILKYYGEMSELLNSIDSNGGPGKIDSQSLNLQSKNGQINFDIAPFFNEIWARSEALLSALYPLIHILRSEGIADFSSALRSITTELEQLNQRRSALSEIVEQGQKETQRIKSLHKESQSSREEIERLKAETEKDRRTLSEYMTESTQSITSIRSASEQADQLKAQVDSYKTTFENFQTQLDKRESTLQEGTKRQEEIFKSVSEIEKTIKDLNERAENMLSGATVAGLAGSFGQLRKDLSKELIWARSVFYFSIFVLFISVIPLAAYVIPGVGEFFSLTENDLKPQSASTAELIGQIAARILLLLPAAWFAKFAAARHAALFRLKEHYAYKYSVASSVEGFKKQAEPYKDVIAATTFYELTFNPADRMDSKGHEDRHPNPAMDWLMKKIGATHDGK